MANKAHLVGAQDGTVLVKMYDWASFLSMKKVVGIKRHHQFRMRGDKPGSYQLSARMHILE